MYAHMQRTGKSASAGARGSRGHRAKGALSAQRQAYRRASMRWHPDAFLRRFGALVPAAEMPAILAHVQRIAQAVNDAWDRASNLRGP